MTVDELIQQCLLFFYLRAVFNSVVELEFIFLLSPHLGEPGELPPVPLVRSLFSKKLNLVVLLV